MKHALTLLTALLLVPMAPLHAAEFHVAPCGNDAKSGREGGAVRHTGARASTY